MWRVTTILFSLPPRVSRRARRACGGGAARRRSRKRRLRAAGATASLAEAERRRDRAGLRQGNGRPAEGVMRKAGVWGGAPRRVRIRAAAHRGARYLSTAVMKAILRKGRSASVRTHHTYAPEP